MDGTSLKKSYEKAVKNADLLLKLSLFGIFFLLISLFLNFLPLIILNASVIIICLPLAIYNAKKSEQAVRLYSWKYDADDLFDNEEDL